MIQSLTIEPPPDQWQARLTEFSARHPRHTIILDRPLTEWRAITRGELANIADPSARIIATGHQPGFFHPGILAKYFTLDAAIAAGLGDTAVEIIVDIDVDDPAVLRCPILDTSDRLHVAELRLDSDSLLPPPKRSREIPTESRPPIASASANELLSRLDGIPTPSSVSDGLASIAAALAAFRSTPSIAQQFAAAASHVRPGAARALTSATGKNPIRIPSSALSRTSLWAAIIQHIQRDSGRAASTYNDAVATRSDAGLPPLITTHPNNPELPLWVIEPDGRRRHAFAADLHRIPSTSFRPRALLLTGLIRLALCDLFIHGTGGAAYDSLTDTWFENWLGAAPSPFVTVSATVLLGFGRPDASPIDESKARWRAHHLRHNIDRHLRSPTMIAHKQAILRMLDQARRHSQQRREAYLRLAALRRDWSRDHADLLAAADSLVNETRRALAERSIIEDRTFAFPLHSAATLDELAGRVAAAFSGW